MGGFWVGASLMLLVAIPLLAVPLWRDARRNGSKAPWTMLAVLALVPASVGLYLQVSTWSAEGAAESAALAAEFEFIESLAERLSSDPDDAADWQLLGRSYLEIGDYGRARVALEQAWNRTAAPDDTLKLSYAESMIYTDEGAALGLAGELIDEVIVSSPANQRALWWGGLIAVERNQPSVAAERWTALLATNPPPEIADLLREQLVLLAANGGGPARGPAAADTGVAVTLDVRVADSIPLDTVASTALLYIAARSPGGGPPLAAEQHPLSALPGRFVLSEADVMYAGASSLAGQTAVTFVARISQGGGATEQPGDFYGEVEVALPATDAVALTIDRVVPPN